MRKTVRLTFEELDKAMYGWGHHEGAQDEHRNEYEAFLKKLFYENPDFEKYYDNGWGDSPWEVDRKRSALVQ